MINQPLLLLLLLPLSTAIKYVHEHAVHAAIVSSSSSSSIHTFSSTDNTIAPPVLPDAFRSFGQFSFIETYEEPDGEKKIFEEDSTKAGKPVPKKLKCSCEFQKVEAETNAVGLTAPASFLEKVVKPTNENSMLRSSSNKL